MYICVILCFVIVQCKEEFIQNVLTSGSLIKIVTRVSLYNYIVSVNDKSGAGIAGKTKNDLCSK